MRFEEELVAELRHEINSPLAAIRNALYLAALRCDDFQVLEYLKLAEEQAEKITEVLRELRSGAAESVAA